MIVRKRACYQIALHPKFTYALNKIVDLWQHFEETVNVKILKKTY